MSAGARAPSAALVRALAALGWYCNSHRTRVAGGFDGRRKLDA